MFGPLPAPLPVVMLIMARVMDIRQRFRRLAERIAAGTYRPMRPSATPRRRPANPRPRQPSPLPSRFNWLEPLLPEAQQARAALLHLFQDPEMAALMEIAPEGMRRPIRSLCWMVGATPPPVLARPRRPPRPPRAPENPPAPAARQPIAKPQRPPLRRLVPSSSLSPVPSPSPAARACGPPHPA
jgi:hypothetical protein